MSGEDEEQIERIEVSFVHPWDEDPLTDARRGHRHERRLHCSSEFTAWAAVSPRLVLRRRGLPRLHFLEAILAERDTPCAPIEQSAFDETETEVFSSEDEAKPRQRLGWRAVSAL